MFPTQPRRIKYTYGKNLPRALPAFDCGRVEAKPPAQHPLPAPEPPPSPGPSNPAGSGIGLGRQQKAPEDDGPSHHDPVTSNQTSPSPRRATRRRRDLSIAVPETAADDPPLPSPRKAKPATKRKSPAKSTSTPRETKPLPKRTSPRRSTAVPQQTKPVPKRTSPRRPAAAPREPEHMSIPRKSAATLVAPDKPLGLGPPRLPVSLPRKSLKRSVSLGDQNPSPSIGQHKSQTALQHDHSPNAPGRDLRRSTSGVKQLSKSLKVSTNSEKPRKISRTVSLASLDFSPTASGSGEVKASNRPVRTRRSAGMSVNEDEQVAGPKDFSDIFAVLENEPVRTVQSRSLPKRRRVTQIPTPRSVSGTALFSPPHSPRLSPESASNDPITRKKSIRLRAAPRLACDGEISESSAQLHINTGRPLSRHVSSEFLGLPSAALDTIGCSNLAAALGTVGGIQKTYGAQRTFKDDEDDVNMLLPIDSELIGSTSSLSRPSSKPGSSRQVSNTLKRKPRETYSELRKKWGVDEDEEETDNNTQLDLRTISHQRTMGSSKRFVDELSYLFEGLSELDNDLDFKRLGALELIKKLNDQEFISNLKTNGMVEQFYDALRIAGAGDGDLILDLILLVFISIFCFEHHQRFLEPVLRILPKNSVDPLSTQSDCLYVLTKVIDGFVSKKLDKSGVCDKALAVGKREAQLLADLAQIVEKSPISTLVTDGPNAITLALFSVASISGFLPRPGLLPQRAIIQSGAYRAILKCLASDVNILKGRLEAYAQGSDLLPSEAMSAVHRVNHCVDVVEACTICEDEGMVALDHDRESLATCFVSLVPLCHILATQQDRALASQGLDILIGCLRTMVNATNDDEQWAELLTSKTLLQTLCGTLNLCCQGYEESVKNSLVRAAEGEIQSVEGDLGSSSHGICKDAREIVFDLICVTLGLFTNIMEQCLNAREILRSIYIHGPGLPNARECCLDCKCQSRISGFEELVDLYLHPPSTSPAEIEFVRGSVCMLLNLCINVEFEQEEDMEVVLEEAIDRCLIRRSMSSLVNNDPLSSVVVMKKSLMNDLTKWKTHHESV